MGVLATPAVLNSAVTTNLEVTRPANGAFFTLDEVYKMLDCNYVEIVRIAPSKVLGERANVFFCDEEFLIRQDKELIINPFAMGFYPGPIYGAVLFCEMLNPGEDNEMYR